MLLDNFLVITHHTNPPCRDLVRLSAPYALPCMPCPVCPGYNATLPSMIGMGSEIFDAIHTNYCTYQCPHCTICPSQGDTGHAPGMSPSLFPLGGIFDASIGGTHSGHLVQSYTCIARGRVHGCSSSAAVVVMVGSMQTTRVLSQGIGSRPVGGTDMPPCYRWVGHSNDQYSTWQGKRPYAYIETGRIRNSCTAPTITASCRRPGTASSYQLPFLEPTTR